MAVFATLAQLVNNAPPCPMPGPLSISSQAHYRPFSIVDILVVVIVAHHLSPPFACSGKDSVMTIARDPMPPTIILPRRCSLRRTGRQASSTSIVNIVTIIINVIVTSLPPPSPSPSQLQWRLQIPPPPPLSPLPLPSPSLTPPPRRPP